MPYSTSDHRFCRWMPVGSVLGLCLALTGCYRGGAEEQEEPQRVDGDDDEDRTYDDPLATCVDTSKFFQERVWTPILKQKCFACHNE